MDYRLARTPCHSDWDTHRFKELNEQSFAEYFLVGSLFSILWAVIITSAWLTYDRNFGIGLQAKLAGINNLSIAIDKEAIEELEKPKH